MSRIILTLAGIALAALCACAVLAVLDWGAFVRAWLVAMLVWSALPLGALAALMTHELTGGGWGELARPVLQPMVATLPLLAIAFVPLLLGLSELFSWTRPEHLLSETVRHKKLYLNIPFFTIRTLLYLGVWLTLAWCFARPHARPRAGLAAPGLVLWVFTLTFFAFDWLMSLQPEWYSDIFGLIWGASVLVAALALLMLMLALASDNEAEPAVSRRQDIANLWLATLLGWAFLAFSQYLLIWSGNIPDEIVWYVHRAAGGWHALSWAVALLLFVLPFVALLSARVKRSAAALGALAVVVLLAHILHVYWLVMPTFHNHGVVVHWVDPLALIALGGLWLAAFALAQPHEQDRYDAGEAAAHG